METTLYLKDYAISISSSKEISLIQDVSNSFSVENNGTTLKINEDNVFITRWDKTGLTIPLQSSNVTIETPGFLIKIRNWSVKVQILPSEDGQLT